jgi:hypothetical protein
VVDNREPEHMSPVLPTSKYVQYHSHCRSIPSHDNGAFKNSVTEYNSHISTKKA